MFDIPADVLRIDKDRAKTWHLQSHIVLDLHVCMEHVRLTGIISPWQLLEICIDL